MWPPERALGVPVATYVCHDAADADYETLAQLYPAVADPQYNATVISGDLDGRLRSSPPKPPTEGKRAGRPGRRCARRIVLSRRFDGTTR